MKVSFKKYTEEILGIKVPYKPSLHGRLGAGAVLDDGERKMWLDWVNNIVKEYEGKI
jgi:sulfite reductase alpha subunit